MKFRKKDTEEPQQPEGVRIGNGTIIGLEDVIAQGADVRMEVDGDRWCLSIR